MLRCASSVHDDVEGFDGKVLVVADGFRTGEQVAEAIGTLLIVFRRQLSALAHAEQPLDGADGDPGGGVQRIAGQGLDDVFLQALFQVGDGGNLRRPELVAGAAGAPLSHQGGHVVQPGQQGGASSSLKVV